MTSMQEHGIPVTEQKEPETAVPEDTVFSDQEIEPGRGRRIRTLTPKAQEQYQKIADSHKLPLEKVWQDIVDTTQAIPTIDPSIDALKGFLSDLKRKCEHYKRLSQTYTDFLVRIHTEVSLTEKDAHEDSIKAQDSFVQAKFAELNKLINKTLKSEPATSCASSKGTHTHSSNKTGSTGSSHTAKVRANAEKAKARMLFVRQEVEIKKQKAALEADLEVLNAEKEVAGIEAEACALEKAYELESESSRPLITIQSLPEEKSEDRTRNYVYDRQPQEGTSLIPTAQSFIPANPKCETENSATNTWLASELTRLLLKKDLLFTSLTNFTDKPELYHTWKTSFQSKMKDLQVNPMEETDLLLKWTGPESQKHVQSLKVANVSDPSRGLQRIWERLDERYGCPEMIQASLRHKLETFPKITNKDSKRLYDLSDIVAEIVAVKEDDKYSCLLSYFDSSFGVTPIVNKLPFNLQERWTGSATRYMAKHCVSYPPFTHFAEFLREQSKIRNNPSFSFATQSDVKPRSTQITVRKTSVIPDKPTTSSSPKEVEEYCPLHNAKHPLSQCKMFKAKPISDRRKFLQERNLCFRCCSPSHTRHDCKSTIHCDDCGSEKHVTALHYDYNINRPSSTQTPKTVSNHSGEQTMINTACAQICGEGFSGKSCAKIVHVKVYHKDTPQKSEKMYALIDDQSNRCLAKPEFFQMFGGSYQNIPYSLSSCGGIVHTSGRRATGFIIEGINGPSLELPPLTECSQIPDIRDEIPTPKVAKHYAHLRDIAPMIPKIDSESSILLLIGRDLIEAHHVKDQRIGPRGSPYAQQLALGWVIIGETCLGDIHRSTNVNVNKTHMLQDGRPSLFPPCENRLNLKDTPLEVSKMFEGSDVFQRTRNDDKPALSVEDRKFLQVMDREFAKDEEGHWVAPLPFKYPRQKLPNNKSVAYKRARNLDSSLKGNPTKREHFMAFMKGIIDNKHAEVAPPLKENEECWYLPLFGVYHPKKPDKIRGVFDSSARFEGVCFNEVLLKGPDLTNSLLGVLLRFRKEAVAITGDVEQMFYCFSVREDHRNFLRFLWYEDNDITKNLVEYRMRKHVFGNSPSPAVATYGLRRTTQEAEDDYGSDVKEFVQKNFYVDDGLASLSSPEQAIDLMSRTQKALLTAGIRLHKISSNNPQVIDAFPKEDFARDLKDLNLGSDKLPAQLSLGICWELESDTITFKVSEDTKPYTRRGILSTVNSLYDPLGLLAPVTIKGKLILRDMIATTSDWDEPLSEDHRDTWEDWVESLDNLGSLMIPRTYHPFQGTVMIQELHVYSDASEKAIAAVGYLRTVNSAQNVHVSFIMGKSKVAPKQGHTIPRLELCASVLAVEIAEVICEELSLALEDVKFYSDSKVVLGYLTNETRRFYVYVANRVSRILKSSKPCQWSYVATEQNPADQGTRYIPAAFLGSSVWISGPSQLWSESRATLSGEAFSLIYPDNDKEIRPEVSVMKSHVDNTHQLTLGSDRFERFSSWNSLVKAIVLLRHIAAGFKSDKRNECSGWHSCSKYKTVESSNKAETLVVKEVQEHFYRREIESLKRGKPLPCNSSVLALSPVLDQDGILRVGGRLKNAQIPVHEKNPILIPGGHHVATLLIRHFHKLVKHQGRHLTEGAVRAAGYWITGGKRRISLITHRCVVCRKLRGRPSEQKMADLPSDRVTPSPPFSCVGVDVFGPWNIITRRTRGGAASGKRWGVLFTCLVTRAIHIELVEEMSSSSFINALRRFCAIRGKVVEFRSDRGTNFVGATADLNVPAINIEDEPIKDFLYEGGSVWKFNPPHSSHFGGVWERLIGVVRRILDSMLLEDKTKNLTHEVLSTFMAEVCAIVNARPIVPVSSDADFPLILTPSTLLTQKTGNMPAFKHFDTKDMYRVQWRHVQVLANKFWSRWRSEYLPTIQTRQKWTNKAPNVLEGDIVLLKDSQVSRNEWPVGIVTRTFPSSDELVRKVELRVIRNGKSSIYVRPISEIIVLISDNL